MQDETELTSHYPRRNTKDLDRECHYGVLLGYQSRSIREGQASVLVLEYVAIYLFFSPFSLSFFSKRGEEIQIGHFSHWDESPFKLSYSFLPIRPFLPSHFLPEFFSVFREELFNNYSIFSPFPKKPQVE